MKIIHVVLGKANPERMNGVNKVAYQLAKNQQEQGHDVTIWGIANTLEHNYPPRNFRTKLFHQTDSMFHFEQVIAKEVWHLRDKIVFHFHGGFIPVFYPISRLLKKRDIPYIYTPHGALTKGAMQKSKWRKKAYFSLYEKTLVKDAKAIQLLGDQEYADIDQLVNVSHKVLIPNGMDTAELPKNLQHDPNQELVFNFCGRLDRYYKGLDLMLAGFSVFLKKGHRARLDLIGDGKDRKYLEELADQLGISDRIVFHGAKYGDEKFRLMAKGDVFMHTSRTEGFPMAVLEAAALGLPCLTSEPTNINHFVRKYNAGFPVNSHPTAASISENMELAYHFFQKNKLKEKGQNARTMVLQAFDWKNICRDLVGVYEA